ncbi:hypothetical protein PR048_023214 [Dryococelus australis]|uniref:Uncharacterized protein n=1 Tax=Dryococelus australis TaxID=614101 RepID=A0ABQ9GTJ9_9NEOP|nr:hypothetical protein PR048_023214 [Dryococelus australis]
MHRSRLPLYERVVTAAECGWAILYSPMYKYADINCELAVYCHSGRRRLGQRSPEGVEHRCCGVQLVLKSFREIRRPPGAQSVGAAPIWGAGGSGFDPVQGMGDSNLEPPAPHTGGAPTDSATGGRLIRQKMNNSFYTEHQPLTPAKFHQRRNAFSQSLAGATVAERLDRSPLTKANRAQSPVGPLPNFRKWESCRTTPLIAGFFFGGSPVSPRPYIPAPLHTSISLIGSQDLAFKRPPKTLHSLTYHTYPGVSFSICPRLVQTRRLGCGRLTNEKRPFRVRRDLHRVPARNVGIVVRGKGSCGWKQVQWEYLFFGDTTSLYAILALSRHQRGCFPDKEPDSGSSHRQLRQLRSQVDCTLKARGPCGAAMRETSRVAPPIKLAVTGLHTCNDGRDSLNTNGNQDSQLLQSGLALPNAGKQESPLPTRDSGHVALCDANMRAIRRLCPHDTSRDVRPKEPAVPTAVNLPYILHQRPVTSQDPRMERCWNIWEGQTGVPRENPPASGIVQHDCNMRKSGSEPAGDPTRIALVGGERGSHCTTAAPVVSLKQSVVLH